MPLSTAERQARFRQRQQAKRAAAIDLFDVEVKLNTIIARYEPLLPNWRTFSRGWAGVDDPGALERLRDVLHSADDARTAMKQLLRALVELDGEADVARLLPEQPGEPS